MKKAVGVLFLIACSSGFLPALLAQQPGQVQGTVEDPTGAPVVAAAVELILPTTGAALKTVTDDTGRFVFTGVAPGEYLLRIKMEGFEKAEVAVQVGTDPTPAQRVRLKVSKVAEEITVSARSSDPNAADQSPSAVQLEHELWTGLPTKNENPLAVASLFVDAAANGVEGTKIVVDGVEGNELDVPSSSVKSITINNNPYSAEFGRPGKGRIEVVTRGGSLFRIHRRFTFTFRDA
ncbi:MAG TPA: carboxypeptidase-like regulatory domain-containing protein, partial [Candidatus Acidoferrales bacterium]|nr:carboxypeptidase-like regulatory domain-containing protein [Candidatus Acidoferrales bacterium]